MTRKRRPLTAGTSVLAAAALFLLAGPARAQPDCWRSRVHIGPLTERDIANYGHGSFNTWFPPDYGPFPPSWYQWPTLREALDQYGLFGRRACRDGPVGSPGPPDSAVLLGPELPPAAPATIRVLVPADALLRIDGQPTAPTGPERLFVTPPLAGERVFGYRIDASWQGAANPVSRT